MINQPEENRGNAVDRDLSLPLHGARPKRRTPIVVYALAALVILIAAGWLIQRYRAVSGPQYAATAFLKTASDEGSLAAYGSAAPTFKASMTTASWQEMVSRLKLSNFYYADWTNYDAHGDAATVRGLVKRLNLPDLMAVMDLRKINDRWRVETLSIEGDQGAPNQPTLTTSIVTPPIDAQAQIEQTPAYPQPSESANKDVSDARDAPAVQTPSDDVPNLASALPSSQLGQVCLSQLLGQGMSIDRVSCKGDLPARIGADQLCYVHVPGSKTVYASVFYNGIDVTTRQPVLSCRMVR